MIKCSLLMSYITRVLWRVYLQIPRWHVPAGPTLYDHCFASYIVTYDLIQGPHVEAGQS